MFWSAFWASVSVDFSGIPYSSFLLELPAIVASYFPVDCSLFWCFSFFMMMCVMFQNHRLEFWGPSLFDFVPCLQW